MSTVSSALYPLLMERRLVHRLWGGQRIVRWLELPEPYPENLGETWEVFDTNRVRNGALMGATLDDVTQRYGAELVGTRTVERYGIDFPLLAKFLDADDKLSIQVHPDDEYAHKYEAATGFHGKTEAWYILSATPGADIFYGLNQPVDRATFAAMVKKGTLEQVLRRVPVSAGDVILMPSGTLHAINAGVMLFEIQEKSDLTYRVYDYGRYDPATGQQRALHLDKALNVARLIPLPKLKMKPLPMDDSHSRMLLVACSHFALERLNLTSSYAFATDPATLEILVVLDGCGTLTWGNDALSVRRGDALVLPATLGEWALHPTDSALQVLRTYVPDLERDIIVPLSERGTDIARIYELLDVV